MPTSALLPPLPPGRFDAVIFDWAGTLVDVGSLAPTQIFVEAFAAFGITVTLDQARGPMGLSKRDHIRTLLQTPAIATQWLARSGQALCRGCAHGGRLDRGPAPRSDVPGCARHADACRARAARGVNQVMDSCCQDTPQLESRRR